MKAPSNQIAIACEGLVKSYFPSRGSTRKPIPVLDGIDLTVARGEFVSLLGPSGGGKSTLLNILAGLDDPDEGRVFLGDLPTDISEDGLDSRPQEGGLETRYSARQSVDRPQEGGLETRSSARKSVGRPQEGGLETRSSARKSVGRYSAYMQQKDLLLPWRSLWDNILLAPELRSRAERKAHESRAAMLVRDFGLEGFENAYPAQLSGGMRQRAALIRTLLCDRDLLLLDEPFGALDALTRTRLQRLLLDVWRRFGKTIVLVTHDVEEAVLLSDRIVLLSELPGRVLSEITVPHPRETRRESPETQRLKNRILRELEGDGSRD